ncbi:SOS response-associated peptidase family protein [Candidatus Nomurabacteria bacterium]|nr:SOS response-associated peptidase family protein [Candidatus Nomurabacteria bacterium]
MPRRIVLGSAIATMEAYFDVESSKSNEWIPELVFSPGDKGLIITQQNPGEITFSSLGMTPAWAEHKMNIIVIRAEGDKNPTNDPSFNGSRAIFLKPAYRKPLFTQRCIVIADAYIECSSTNESQPFLFFLQHQQRPFGMAGLYDLWKDPASEDIHHSFAIITVPGNSLARKMGVSRMPLILPRGKEKYWLKPTNSLTDILQTLVKYPAELMNAYPINNRIMKARSYSKEMLKPTGEILSKETESLTLSRKTHRHDKKSEVSHWLGNKTL